MNGKILKYLVLVVLVHCSLLVYAETIYLHDGKEILIDSYWEENDLICYEKYGAVIKLEKSRVKEIISSVEDKDDNKNSAGLSVQQNDNAEKEEATWVYDGQLYINDGKGVHSYKVSDSFYEKSKQLDNTDAEKSLDKAETKVPSISNARQQNSLSEKNNTSSSQFKALQQPIRKSYVVKVPCKACNGTGLVKGWEWGKEYVMDDSYGHPIYKPVQVPKLQTCPVCNGTRTQNDIEIR